MTEVEADVKTMISRQDDVVWLFVSKVQAIVSIPNVPQTFARLVWYVWQSDILCWDSHAVTSAEGPCCKGCNLLCDVPTSSEGELMTVVKLIIVPSIVEVIKLLLCPRKGVRTMQVEVGDIVISI